MKRGTNEDRKKVQTGREMERKEEMQKKKIDFLILYCLENMQCCLISEICISEIMWSKSGGKKYKYFMFVLE